MLDISTLPEDSGKPRCSTTVKCLYCVLFKLPRPYYRKMSEKAIVTKELCVVTHTMKEKTRKQELNPLLL